MKIAARRRLAVSVLAATSVVAGLAVLPALAADGGLRVDPSAAFNSNPSQTLTFTSTSGDTDFRYGGEATFTLLSRPAVFTVDIAGSDLPIEESNQSTGEVDLTDVDGGNDEGVGKDGPADAGTYRVLVMGSEAPLPGLPGGGGTDSCPSCFIVLPQAQLTLTSVAPSSLRPNDSARDASFLGTGFTRSSTIQFLNKDGSVDNTINASTAPLDGDGAAIGDDITTNTQLRRRLVTTNSAAGPRDVRVTNPDGMTSTCVNCFTVAGAPLSGINPPGANNAPPGVDTTITVTGTSIADGQLTLEFLDVPGSSTRSALTLPTTRTSYSSTSLSALLRAADLANAAPGRYQPVVRSSTGVVNACDCVFTVAQDRAITVTGVDATGSETGRSQQAGTTKTFDITGTNFARGAAVTVSGTGVTTTQVVFVSPTLLQATFQSTSAAAPGARNVTVTLTDGKTATCSGCYTVTAGASPGASPSATPTATMSPSASPSGSQFSFARLQGAERYATAARIATSSAATAATVILANGQSDDPRTARNENHFPDALAAAYLAGNRNAPTLLTMETDLPTATENALETLDPQNVVIVGGPAAVGTGVERELRAKGYTVSRIAGNTRYDTAAAVAAAPGANYVGTAPQGERAALLASGQDFPDALVAGPIGYRAKFPVMITTTSALSPQTKKSLQDLQIKRVLITGGTAVVSAKVEQEVQALGITTQRLEGTNRSGTAVAVATYAYDQLGFDRSHVNLARGDQFPDALAGGPHGGREGAPILLTLNARTVGTQTLNFLQARGSALRSGHIFGGTVAVSQQAEDDAEAAVRRGASSGSASPSSTASGTASPSTTASGSASPSTTASASPRPSGSASPATSPRPSGTPTPTPSASAGGGGGGGEMCIPGTEICNPL